MDELRQSRQRLEFSALISCGNDMDIARESERTSSMTTAHSDEPANIILNPAVFDERERVLRIQPLVVDVSVGKDNRRVGRSSRKDDAHEFIHGRWGRGGEQPGPRKAVRG